MAAGPDLNRQHYTFEANCKALFNEKPLLTVKDCNERTSWAWNPKLCSDPDPDYSRLLKNLGTLLVESDDVLGTRNLCSQLTVSVTRGTEP